MGHQRRKVLLLHGINTKQGAQNDWYPTVADILRPWFNPIPIRYTKYSSFGAFKLASEYAVLWLALALLFSASGLLFILPSFAIATFGIGLAILLLGAILHFIELQRRRDSLMEVLDELDKKVRTAGRVDLICHSMGTYQAAQLLQMHPTLLLRVGILCGSILPRCTPWGKILRRNSPRLATFLHIRNEISEHDHAVRAAGWAAAMRVISGVGTSGNTGFVRAANDTDYPDLHTLDNPIGPCDHCGGRVGAAQAITIHNVPLQFYGHSTHFMLRKHATDLWLPTLWEFEPIDCIEFWLACFETRDGYLDAAVGLPNRAHLRDELLNAEFRCLQAPGKTVATLLRIVLAHLHGRHRDEITPEQLRHAVGVLCSLVCEVYEGQDIVDRKALLPRWSVITAARMAARSGPV